jgi:signal peptidase I
MQENSNRSLNPFERRARNQEHSPEQETQEEDKLSNEQKQSSSVFFELAKVVLFALILVTVVRTFLFQPFFVQGASMEPNYYDGEYLIVNEFGYKETVIGVDDLKLLTVKPFRELRRGDVIVFRYPKNIKQFFIKRVIGLPGEKVEIKNNQVKVYNSDYPSGVVLDEASYLPSFTATSGDETYNLSEKEYLVLGDNRSHSSDSRFWGPVPTEDIIGKVVLRAWPLERFGFFN